MTRRLSRRHASDRSPALAALLLVWLIHAPVWAAQDGPASSSGTQDRIAVLPLEIVGAVPAGRSALEAAVLRGLAVLAAPAIAAGEAESRLQAASARPPCDTAECWTAIGRAVDARYLVLGKVERKANLFDVRFHLVDAHSGRLLATLGHGCDVDDCSVAEQCRLVVRELTRQTLGQLSDAPSPPPAMPPVAAMDPLARPDPMARGATERPPDVDRPAADPSRRKTWGTAAIVAGAVAAAAGGVLIYYDGRCADKSCFNLRDSLVPGIASASIGVALAATGVVLHLTGNPDSSSGAPQLSVGWGSAFLSGRF